MYVNLDLPAEKRDHCVCLPSTSVLLIMYSADFRSDMGPRHATRALYRSEKRVPTTWYTYYKQFTDKHVRALVETSPRRNQPLQLILTMAKLHVTPNVTAVCMITSRPNTSESTAMTIVTIIFANPIQMNAPCSSAQWFTLSNRLPGSSNFWYGAVRDKARTNRSG